MGTILLVVYITAAVSMIVLILLQRSEGGALGIGGGGGGLGIRPGRGKSPDPDNGDSRHDFLPRGDWAWHPRPSGSAIVGCCRRPSEGARRREHARLGTGADGASAEQPSRAQAAQAQARNGTRAIVGARRPVPQRQPRRLLHCRNFRSRSKRRRAARVRLDADKLLQHFK